MSLSLLFELMRRVDALLKEAVAGLRTDAAPTIDPALRGLVVTEGEVFQLVERAAGSRPAAWPVWGGALWAAMEEHREQGPEARFRTGFDLVRERFRLSVFETEVVIVCLAPELDSKYEKLFGYLNDDVTRKWPTVDLLLRLLGGNQADAAARRRLLASDATLLQGGLLEYVEDSRERENVALLSRQVRLRAGLVRYLLDDPGVDPDLFEVWSAPDSAAVITVPSYRQAVEHLEAALDGAGGSAEPAASPLVCLIQGRSGAGRRRLAEQACARRGLGMIPLDCRKLAGSEHAARILLHAFRDALLRSAPVLLENADYLWSDAEAGASSRRCLPRLLLQWGWLTFLTVSPGFSPPAWLRRLNLVLVTIPPLTVAERQELWNGGLANPADPDARAEQELAAALSARFRLTPGEIELAQRTAMRQRPAPSGPAERAALLHRICASISAPQLGELAQLLVPRYGWDDLVLPERRLELLRDLVRQVQHRRRVSEDWGFGRTHRSQGLNALFAGPSGTGKTMAAEVIAGFLGMDLYRIDLATVVSKYIGETEKNLSRIFQEAEHSDAVLFFDEADALFGKRSQVRDAHDRYANIEINYLLQQMERFEGIAILATNLRQNLDDAFLRRLHIVVEFPLPGPADRLRIWQKVFPSAAPRAPDLDLEFLARRFDLTGGSIRNSALTAAFLAAEAGTAIGMLHCLLAVQREQEKLGKRVMREEFGEYYELLPRPLVAASA
jgi:hypothetical protein